MRQRSNIVALGMALFAFLIVMGSSAHGQDAGRSWALKSGVGGIFTGHIAGEVEVFLKGRVSIALRGALIYPNIDSLRSPAEGFFIKAGPKFYLSKEKASNLAGFAVKPEVVFSNWRNWDAKTYVVPTEVWENTLGVLVTMSYGWQPFEHVLIEPHFGLGYVPTFDQVNFQNDQEPFDVHKVRWQQSDQSESAAGIHDHLDVAGFLSISGGINIGIKF